MSGIIPRPFIDELLSRTDIVEFIDSHIPLKKVGSSYVACCPFHNEKTPSFNVIARKQFYHCFGCGASGNAISFAIDYLHQNFPEAVETLAARIGMQVPREGSAQKNHQSQSLYKLLEKVSDFYQNQLRKNAVEAVGYLKQRGINGETAKRFQLGYAPAGWHTLETALKSNTAELIASGMLIQREDGQTYDRYRQRITYPIRDRLGRIVGFGGRAITVDQKPKYLNSPETVIFQKSRELYGLYQIIESRQAIPNLLVVEGYMDVIALSQHGIDNAVATLGTATSSFHIQLILKHTKQIIFCFDGDAAGTQAAWRALESSLPFLNDGLDAQFVFLPDGFDPDSLVREQGKDALLKRIKTAIPLNQLLFNTLLQSVDITTVAGKSQLVNAIKPYVLKINEGSYKQLILNELSRLTHIETHRLHALIGSTSLSSPSDSNKIIQRSPIRIAIALLMQHPEAYLTIRSQLPDDFINRLQQPILKQIVEHIQHNANITTGTLLECFRNTQLFDALSKLVAWDHQVPSEALTRELADTLQFLAKQDLESKIQKLINKARQNELSNDDRLYLQHLLKQRHQPIDKEISTD